MSNARSVETYKEKRNTKKTIKGKPSTAKTKDKFRSLVVSKVSINIDFLTIECTELCVCVFLYFNVRFANKSTSFKDWSFIIDDLAFRSSHIRFVQTPSSIGH